MKWGAEVVEDIAEHYEKLQKDLEEYGEKVSKNNANNYKTNFIDFKNFEWVLASIFWLILTLYLSSIFLGTANPIKMIQIFYSFGTAQFFGFSAVYFIFTFPLCFCFAYVILMILAKLK